MEVQGNELKDIFEKGLMKHGDEVPKGILADISRYSDELVNEKIYDLFSVIMDLMMTFDKEIGIIITELMKTSNAAFEISECEMIQTLGYTFESYLKRDIAQQYFKQKKCVNN